MTIHDILQAHPNALLKTARHIKGTIFEHSDMYVYVDRSAPITLVAHVDTVRGKDKMHLVTRNGIIRNSGGVLGADDRAGVYAMFRLAGLNCNLLFTNHEESGGRGAKQASKDLNQHMIDNGVRLMIELDRSGVSEYVYYSETLPKQIIKYIESYGYSEEFGSYSDIAEFDTIPAVNLSVGYYRQHTGQECLHVDELQLTINRVRQMIDSPPVKLYPVDPPFVYDWRENSRYELHDWNETDIYERGEKTQSVDEFFRSPVKWKKGGI